MLCVIPFDDDDDAVRIANDSIYGLSGAVTSGERGARARGGAAHPHRHDLGQRRACGSTSTRRSAATARAASAARTALLGFEEYLETKVIALPGEGVKP